MSTRYFHWDGLQVGVDRRRQVLQLDIDPKASWEEARDIRRGKIVTSPGDGVITVINPQDDPGPHEAPLYPSIAAMPDEGPFVSAAVLARKAKAVDDGIVATLELILDEGSSGFLGRSALLAELQARLQEDWDGSRDDQGLVDAIGLLSAARSLAGDDDPAAPTTAIRLRKSRYLQAWRMKPENHVALGVYSWSDRLAGLYRQGKGLQEPLKGEVARALARALEADESLLDAYHNHIALMTLTNPLVSLDLISWSDAGGPGEPPPFFPASESPEGRLGKILVGASPVPPGFDLIGELIARVGDGRETLEPTEESGWYDHVLHALAPLVAPDRVPEAPRLRLAPDYRDDLRQLFRSLLGMTRETHVKQMEMPHLGAGRPPLLIHPSLTLEPLAEHYRRRADSYRFVRERLVGLLGEDVLRSRNRETSTGETRLSLLDEIVRMEQLYVGAWAIVRDELGLDPVWGEPEGRWVLAARAMAHSWVATHRVDPDIAEDVRMMVPLFQDIQTGEFHILAVIGYEQRNLNVRFVEPPGVDVRDGRGRRVEPEIEWTDATYPLARPVTLTCRTRRLLDRDQFRALCDREKTPAAIRAALEA